MKETGTITAIEKISIEIEILPEEECTKCSSCRSGKTRRIELPGHPGENYKVGDHVEVEIPSSIMMKVSLLLYGLPLAAFVSALLIIYYLSKNPILSFFAGIMFLTTALFLSTRFARKFYEKTPTIRLI